MLYYFDQTSDRGGDDGYFHSHKFDGGDTEGLAPAGDEGDIKSAYNFGRIFTQSSEGDIFF